jgi:hypothetical protein
MKHDEIPIPKTDIDDLSQGSDLSYNANALAQSRGLR